jgi:6-phosphogluconolactonase/glucosamine-6-phosphate isomerase/deaminase
LPLINLARNVIFLAIGPEKKKIVDAIFENPDKSQLIYPAALVHPEEEIVWFVGDYVI